MDELIPLSHLSLDLPEPLCGWESELARRGVPVVEDDIARRCVGRRAARMLISEAPIRSAIWAVLTPASLSERASIRRARCCRLLRASARCDTPPSFPLAIGYPLDCRWQSRQVLIGSPVSFRFRHVSHRTTRSGARRLLGSSPVAGLSMGGRVGVAANLPSGLHPPADLPTRHAAASQRVNFST